MLRFKTEEVVQYIHENPGCSSKEIAEGLGVHVKSINKKCGEYPGVYSLPGIRHENFKHYPITLTEQTVSSTVAAPVNGIPDSVMRQLADMQERITKLEKMINDIKKLSVNAESESDDDDSGTIVEDLSSDDEKVEKTNDLNERMKIMREKRLKWASR